MTRSPSTCPCVALAVVTTSLSLSISTKATLVRATAFLKGKYPLNFPHHFLHVGRAAEGKHA
jgi:hypothetical protein